MDDFRADMVRVMNNNTEEDGDMVTYKTLADVPSYYKNAVQKAVDKGVLNGTGSGELNVSEDLCRTGWGSWTDNRRALPTAAAAVAAAATVAQTVVSQANPVGGADSPVEGGSAPVI